MLKITKEVAENNTIDKQDLDIDNIMNEVDRKLETKQKNKTKDNYKEIEKVIKLSQEEIRNKIKKYNKLFEINKKAWEEIGEMKALYKFFEQYSIDVYSLFDDAIRYIFKEYKSKLPPAIQGSLSYDKEDWIITLFGRKISADLGLNERKYLISDYDVFREGKPLFINGKLNYTTYSNNDNIFDNSPDVFENAEYIINKLPELLDILKKELGPLEIPKEEVEKVFWNEAKKYISTIYRTSYGSTKYENIIERKNYVEIKTGEQEIIGGYNNGYYNIRYKFREKNNLAITPFYLLLKVIYNDEDLTNVPDVNGDNYIETAIESILEREVPEALEKGILEEIYDPNGKGNKIVINYAKLANRRFSSTYSDPIISHVIIGKPKKSSRAEYSTIKIRIPRKVWDKVNSILEKKVDELGLRK